MTPDRQRAERIILEILRQAENGLGKTRIYKAFWLAHLYYAQKEKGFLSSWPIVRMPRGPGIENGKQLLNQLVTEGYADFRPEPCGPFTEQIFTFKKMPDGMALNTEECEAIGLAVKDVSGATTAAALSKVSHEISRSWNTKDDGEELDLYTDLISDDDFERMTELAKAFDKAFKNSA